MRVALGLGAAVVGDVDLAAEDRLDALLGGVAVELDRAGHGAVVGEPDGGHLELSGAGRERRNPAGPIEDGVLGVDVKVDELRLGHGKPILDLAQDRTRLAEHRLSRRRSSTSGVEPITRRINAGEGDGVEARFNWRANDSPALRS